MKSKIVNIIVPILIILLMYISTIYAYEISLVVKDSIMVCLECIVPSMYGFMIVSDILVRTNSHQAIGRVFSPLARYVFHLDGKLFSILLISLVAGYPVGAKMIASLERTHSIDIPIAQNMYCYCYSGGLAFVLGTIGKGSEYGLKITLIIYISNVIANLLLAILLNFKNDIPKKDISSIKVSISSNILIDSINSSFRVIVTICTMILAFSIIISLLDSLSISCIISNIGSRVFNTSATAMESILRGILEISNVTNLSTTGRYYIPILASMFSFGGVCVILQIVSLSGKSFNLGKFLTSRIFTCGISFVVSKVLCEIFLKNYTSVGYLYTTKVTENTSVVPSICLIFMSFILLSKSTRHFSEKVI